MSSHQASSPDPIPSSSMDTVHKNGTFHDAINKKFKKKNTPTPSGDSSSSTMNATSETSKNSTIRALSFQHMTWSDQEREEFTKAAIQGFIQGFTISSSSITHSPLTSGRSSSSIRRRSDHTFLHRQTHSSYHNDSTYTENYSHNTTRTSTSFPMSQSHSESATAMKSSSGHHGNRNNNNSYRNKNENRVSSDECFDATASSYDSSSSASSSSHMRRPGQTSSEDHQKSGLQFRAMAHLVDENQFDEDFLSSLPTTTLNWTIKSLGKKGRIDLAEQLFHWMRVCRVANEHSWVKLCEAYEHARMPTRATLTWRAINRMTSSVPITPRSTAALLKVFRTTGDLKGALEIMEELLSKRAPMNRYGMNAVLRICADMGDSSTALRLVESALQRASRAGVDASRFTEDSAVDVRTFSALMDSIAASQRYSRTASVHKLLEDSGVHPDETLYLQLIAGYAGAARPEAAEALFDRMMDVSNMKPNRTHWNALMFAYAEARRYDGCLNVYRRMKVAGLEPTTYTIVALLHAAKGSGAGHAAAKSLYSEMKRCGVKLTTEIGTALISCCQNALEGADAEAALSFAAEIYDAMIEKGVVMNIKTYNSMMAVYSNAMMYSKVKEMFEMVERMEEVEPDEATWSIVLKAFESAGWWRDVEAMEMLKDTWMVLNHGER